ncbi:uncharacterized protein LOC119075899 [Bradysia coprophila]|uniref:uncharacterized protein LOC119075899 n=1 Tax=Bradysia coprophila TaxID=38358 RepID=UPI00187DB6BA|nr:uncharacterized protein LOC119075899 [Bradysia coprophila]
MEWTPVDWQKIFEDEASDRTAVIISAQRAHFLRDINLPCDFDQYGVVETFRYERYNGYHYSIIQFADAASATNLLRKRYITVRGVDFIVKPFHSVDDLIKSLQCMNGSQPSYHTASDNSERNILHYLNDDCLGEIFRRIHSLFDVVSIENVCTRFRRIAATTFIPLLKRKEIDFTELKPGGNGITVTDIERFLRRHGPAIVSVQLCEHDYRNMSDVVNPILKLLQKHCANLKSLTLFKEPNFRELQDQTLIDIRPLLSKLTYVEIWHQTIYGCRNIPTGRYVELITACTAVETLIANIDSFTLPEINFPQLRVFQTNCVYSKPDQFIGKNRQIEALDIPCKPALLRLIAENMPKCNVFSST